MFEKIIFILLIQLYWFSLPLIGYALLHLLRETIRKRGLLHEFAAFCLKQPIVVRFFFSFLVTITILGVACVPLYLLGLPAIVLTLVYIILFASSIGYGIARFVKKKVYKKSKQITISLNKPPLTLLSLGVVGVAALLVAFDYVLSLKLGATIFKENDVAVHLAKIMTILNHDFSLKDGFYGTVIESRYHFNVVHTLYVPLVQLIDVVSNALVVEAWRWSLAFFRFMQWVAVFSLAYFIFKYWIRANRIILWSWLTTIAAISIYAGLLYYADYPNQMVNLWIISYVMGLIIIEFRKAGSILLFLSAFLITVTHPSYGLIVAIFTIFYIVLRLIFDFKKFKRQLSNGIIYIVSVVILIVSGLITKIFPNNFYPVLSESENHLVYTRFLPPSSIGGGEWLLFAIAVVATIYLLIKLRERRSSQLIVVALTLFIPIIIFNPVAVLILGKLLHISIFYRFMAMNVLLFTSVGIAAFGAYELLKKYKPLQHRRKGLYLGCILVVLIVGGVYVKPSYDLLSSRLSRGSYREYDKLERTYNSFNSYLTKDRIVVANTMTSYFLPQVLPVNVIAIPWQHATPNSATPERTECQSSILADMSAASIKEIGASYVLLSFNDSDLRARSMAQGKPYLNEIARNKDFVLYKFNEGLVQNDSTPPAKACIEYQMKERNN